LKQGEKISKLGKCFAKSYSFTFDYLQKDFEKNLQKEFAKTKHVVQAWSKILKIFIGSILSNLCTYNYAN
jgi:hypothetical protein